MYLIYTPKLLAYFAINTIFSGDPSFIFKALVYTMLNVVNSV